MRQSATRKNWCCGTPMGTSPSTASASLPASTSGDCRPSHVPCVRSRGGSSLMKPPSSMILPSWLKLRWRCSCGAVPSRSFPRITARTTPSTNCSRTSGWGSATTPCTERRWTTPSSTACIVRYVSRRESRGRGRRKSAGGNGLSPTTVKARMKSFSASRTAHPART